jgi:D-sedoheptulose 7-phosphate isomerase
MDRAREVRRARFEEILKDAADTHVRAAATLGLPVALVAEVVTQAFLSGGKLLLFGNGGSAADAQHIAAELEGRLRMERRGLPALALTVNPSVLTAVSNDYGYDAVFARQVEALAKTGDVAIGISTSGASVSVLRGLDAARAAGAVTVGMTGERGGPMAEHCDHLLKAPASDTQRIQEIHIAIGHALCELVEAELFGDESKRR